MADGFEYRFRIDAYTPATIPMARLAEYMRDLAALLGYESSVHFVRLDEGSTVLVNQIEDEAVPKVRERVASVRGRDGPDEAMRAYREINRRLAQDNGSGVLSEDDASNVIEFPGAKERPDVSFGAFNQEGSLDGVLIRLGGTGDWVPVHLHSENRIYTGCQAKRDVAQRLAPYIFETPLRVYGSGRWHRDEDGVWILDRFTIVGFEELDDTPLSSVVARLRAIPDSEWDDVDDPLTELQRLRNGSDAIQ